MAEVLGSLAGKTVFISGAAGGLGRALVAAFAHAGANLALADLDPVALADLAASLSPAPALALPLDVTDEAACAQAVAQAVAHFGGVDVLVNNAGITHRSLFEDTRTEVLRRVMDVNLFGSVYLTRATLPGLKASRGQVVVISSVAGFSPLVGRTGYAASKHALHGFFESLRAELAPAGVNVLMVCPSFVRTPIEQNALSGAGEKTTGVKQYTGPVLEPEDLAAQLVDAVKTRQRLLLPTRLSRLAWWLSRLWPARYERVMIKRQGAEFGR